MVFDLTDSIAQRIAFAMENQEADFVLDARSGSVVPAEEKSADEETVYTLPSWDSHDGYRVLESFVSGLHAQKAKQELKNVLIAGRGVFRNFKAVIKQYPEVERKWHFYKEKQMRFRLMEWYNALRESWGLEVLSEDFDDSDDLIEEDFVFRAYNPVQDKDCVALGADAVFAEYEKSAEGELGQAFAELFARSDFGTTEDTYGFVCRTLTDDFAGCLMVSPFPSCAKKTVIMTRFFVNQNYRGLGIARALLSFCLSQLREHGVRWFIMVRVPQILEPTLIRFGFEKNDAGFVADLNKES
ncbi:MAG: GNAT family N-acetyltransferase [Treponema sp.]|nr:GNAT family N-acetyltransferase [Treponema sp.]